MNPSDADRITQAVVRVFGATTDLTATERLLVLELAWSLPAANARNDAIQIGGDTAEQLRQVEQLEQLATWVRSDMPDLEAERLFLKGDTDGAVRRLLQRASEHREQGDTVVAGDAKDAIIQVGTGRGFLVKTKRQPWSPLVITAAHCLPDLPVAHRGAFTEERTYKNLLGPVGATPNVWTECVFVDPIADIAVLAGPDSQELSDEAEAYERLVENRPTLRLAAITRRSPARLLTLDGRWAECAVDVGVGGYSLVLIGAQLVGGMSGSPILNNAGHVVGVVSLGMLTGDVDDAVQRGQPPAINTLPAWLLAEVLDSVKDISTVITAQERAWWHKGG